MGRHFLARISKAHPLFLALLLLPHGALGHLQQALYPLHRPPGEAEPDRLGGDEEFGFPQAQSGTVDLLMEGEEKEDE